MQINRAFLAAFGKLFKGYWKSEEKKSAILLFLVVIGLNFAMVYLLVLINGWYNEFYNALQAYEWQSFWPLVGKFTGLAFCYIAIAVYAIYLRQLLQIRWRSWMTGVYLDRYLEGGAYYRLKLYDSDMDNPDQRIQEDVGAFVSLTLQLILGFLKQLTTLGAFAVVLWELSGEFSFNLGGMEVKIPGYMLWFSLLYSLIGTILAHKVGQKLIALNFDQQRYEADLRFSLTRLRENSESVAFYRGEKAERQTFDSRFAAVVANFRHLMQQTKILNSYSNGYAQLAIIVPLVMCAPRYFAGKIQLGGLMQTTSAFGRVQDALSYFVDAYDAIAQLVAVTYRLTSFTEHLETVKNNEPSIKETVVDAAGGNAADAAAVGTAGGTIELKNICVKLPDGTPLLNNLSLELSSLSSILITGKSGCGKSTLLRTLALLWPYGGGEIVKPGAAKIMFLPQRPYLPLGTLKQAILYPQTESGRPDITDEVLQKGMALAQLGHLAGNLNEVDDWSRILSLGEQQRIAFLRLYLLRPDFAFLDEATSALDEKLEEKIYAMVKAELPDVCLVSVGHRSTLFAFHGRELHLNGDGSYSVREI